MKAVVCTKYGTPEVLKVTEINKPTPQDHEILINIKATTVSAADVRVRGFRLPKSFWLPAKLILGFNKPRKGILGMEVSGIVEDIGKSVKKFKVGDKVFAATLKTFGGYAEYICLSEHSALTTMPKNLSYSESAVLPIGARTAYHYLKNFAKISNDI